MTNDPTKSTEFVDEEPEVVEPELPEPADEQAQEPEVALAEDAATEAEPVEGADAQDPVASKAAKADEYLALAQRTQADFENYRKRATREAAAAQARGLIKLAKELLPAVDDLDRALAAAEAAAEQDGADNPLVKGIKLVHADMV